MADRHGPYRSTRFELEIDGINIAGFQEVTLPSQSTEEVEYREGNDPPSTRKLWGLTQSEDLELSRGVTDDTMELVEWREQVESGDVDDARKTVAVIVQDEQGESGARWEFENAWPKEYQTPDLDAQSSDIAIETLVLAHEGMTRRQ